MTAYYNEIDPFCAEWLRNLIDAGHIAPGVVDTRSIEDVIPEELAEFTQCHFFAGIGIWSLALRRAGWSDDRPVWTGSCPCQPFSSAGKGAGFDDERHLWPAFHHLIRAGRPGVVFGEQVASKDGLAWLELVQADLETAGYRSWAADLCAAGFASPEDAGTMGGAHIRQRLYWGAYRMADADDARSQGRHGTELRKRASKRAVGARSASGGMADTVPAGRPEGRSGSMVGQAPRSGSVDWLPCRDGKYRPVEGGTFPLAHEDSARVGRLRAYGNALDAATAQAFIGVWMEAMQ